MTTDDEGRGGIIRVEHDKHRPYFVMSKALAEDTRLTYAARGMMAYLLAKPDDWEIRLDDLISSSPGGLRHVRSLLRELGEAGYLKRTRERNGGRFVWITTVYESPSAQNVSMVGPSAQNVPMASSPSIQNVPMVEPPSARFVSIQNPPIQNVPIYQVPTELSTKRPNTKERKSAANGNGRRPAAGGSEQNGKTNGTTPDPEISPGMLDMLKLINH